MNAADSYISSVSIREIRIGVYLIYMPVDSLIFFEAIKKYNLLLLV
jgi:hypothetical protein